MRDADGLPYPNTQAGLIRAIRDGWAPTSGVHPVNWTRAFEPESRLYASLRRVLDLAFAQAAEGKGKERHASEGTTFEAQPMVTEGLEVGSNHFAIGQARKKLRESTRLEKDATLREILGAINYAVGAYLVRERLP